MKNHPDFAASTDSVTLPRPTAAPLILSAGVALAAAGITFGVVFAIVGAIVFAAGLGAWVAHLLPGRGHVQEEIDREAEESPPLRPRPGTVEHIAPGMAGYRLRLPTEIPSISSGVLGGVAGGVVMPIAPLAYSLITGHGIWYPLSLLAGTMMPGVVDMPIEALEQFHPGLFAAGVVMHIAMSLVLGLIYGVLLPTLPEISKPVVWGAMLMPLGWSAITFLLLEPVNPSLARGLDWPSFLACQFVYGIIVSLTYLFWAPGWSAPVRGLIAGAAGGLFMPLPAFAWGLVSGKGAWYPANLLAAMIQPEMAELPPEALQFFRQDWLAAAILVHASISLLFGLTFGLVVHVVPRIPSVLAWGGALLPLLWTATCYGLMGIVNPLLEERVDWAWFIVSQFVFGLTAALVVLRSSRIAIPPAGMGPGATQEEHALGPRGFDSR